MGIFAAGFGSCLIDRTIIFSVEERTWGGFQNIIIVLVDSEILRRKISWFHTEKFGDSFDVRRIKDRAGCLAAVRTGEAIYLFKYFLMRVVKNIIDRPGIFLFQLLQKLSILGSFLCCSLSECF